MLVTNPRIGVEVGPSKFVVEDDISSYIISVKNALSEEEGLALVGILDSFEID